MRSPELGHGLLPWLRRTLKSTEALLIVTPGWSEAAFEGLIGYWAGILVSDNYRLGPNCVNARQTCLARLTRTAKWLAG